MPSGQCSEQVDRDREDDRRVVVRPDLEQRLQVAHLLRELLDLGVPRGELLLQLLLRALRGRRVAEALGQHARAQRLDAGEHLEPPRAQAAAVRRAAVMTLPAEGWTTDDWRQLLVTDADAQVRAAAVRLASADLLPDLLAVKDDPAPLVLAHLAIRLSAANQPAADRTLAELLTRHGKNALIREGALSGARGREVALAQAVAAVADRANLTETGPVLEALAALVSQAGKGGPFEQMLAVAVTLDDRTNLRDAVLRGLDQTIRDTKTKKTSPLKTIWLSSEPAPLARDRKSVV